MPSCTILVLGHLPSPDNKEGLRSTDIDCDREAATNWLENIALARPVLRCFGLLVAGAYCPDTIRHATSARLLAEALGLAQPIDDPRLNNIDYGRYKGRPLSDTPRLADLDERYDGGESWNDVASRWRAFCAEVLTGHPGQLVLLAGQSATAPRMLRHLCNGVPLREAVDQPVPTIPFFSTKLDFPTENLVWRYSW
jgi:broad specificity phosphatase PhoE